MTLPALLRQLWIAITARTNGGRRRTPTVLQMEMTECGAASLSIILQYYGRYIPLTELRQTCGVSRDGSDAASLIKAARSYGLEAKGFKMGLARLKRETPPLILFWEFNHFLVFEGFIGERVGLNDPASGPRTVSLDEFDRSYTGVALEIKPGPTFRPGGRRPSFWVAVGERLLIEKAAIVFLLLAGLAMIVPSLLMPVFSQIFIDEIWGNQLASWQKPLFWGMAITILAQLFIQHMQRLGNRLLARRLDRRFAARFEHHVLALPERFFTQRYAGDINNRVDLNSLVSSFIAEQLLPLASGSLLLIFYLLITFLYSPILGGIVVASTALNALAVSLNLRFQRDASLQLQKDGAKAQAVVISAIRDIETVKTSAIEQDIFTRFAGYQSKLLNFRQNLNLRQARLELIPIFFTTFNNVVVLVVGFILVLRGQLTLGMLLAAQQVAMNLKIEIDKVITFVRQLPTFESSLLRLEDVLEQPIDPLLQAPQNRTTDAPPVSRPRLSGKVVIRDLRFGYLPMKPPLIDGLNLVINPGQRVAFVGGSGSGKSTLARLIAGLYQPSGGEILFDGRPLAMIPRAVAVRSLAMVQQEIQLYGCSVRDNLTLWRDAVEEDRIEEACADAQILDLVRSLPEGFDTRLNEGARNLSGGQRQRLEIARALVQDPAILVLDEATSALDSETERRLDEALRRRGCTQIIVAHRLSTIRDADEILVMEQGQVVQRGRHQEMVMGKGTPYALLLEEVAEAEA
jgi:NHLM bacteriocin system ABC transporter peptidase/ATP-binding protein